MTILLGAVSAPLARAADEAPAVATDAAKAAVAAYLGTTPDAVKIVSSVSRDFPDSSLDCREPGFSYLQVITPGEQIVAEAEGRRFDVRVAGSAARICRQRNLEGNAPKPTSPARQRAPENSLAVTARADLAQRLGVGVTEIAVLGVKRREPGEQLAGCETSCSSGNSAEQCGYVISLEFEARSFQYWSHAGQLSACPAIESK